MKNSLNHFAFVAALLLGALLSSACAGSVFKLDGRIYYKNPLHNADIEIQYSQIDSEQAEAVSLAVRDALPKVTQWGNFKDKLVVRIHPTHSSLEKQINRHGYPWLRGWARYDSIDLQSPRTWGGDRIDMRIQKMMTHEMTHVVMYQNGGKRHNWYRKDFPLWFREGMASVTAEQVEQRGPRSDIRNYYLRGALEGDPVGDGDRMVKGHPHIVYLVSHWIFVDLMDEFGKDKIVNIIKRVGDGERFGLAWRSVCGISLEKWLETWRKNYSKPADS